MPRSATSEPSRLSTDCPVTSRVPKTQTGLAGLLSIQQTGQSTQVTSRSSFHDLPGSCKDRILPIICNRPRPASGFAKTRKSASGRRITRYQDSQTGKHPITSSRLVPTGLPAGRARNTYQDLYHLSHQIILLHRPGSSRLVSKPNRLCYHSRFLQQAGKACIICQNS